MLIKNSVHWPAHNQDLFFTLVFLIKFTVKQDMITLIQNYQAVPKKAQKAVVLIGNFDGLHRGHQTLIETGQKLAEQNNVPLAIMSFNPHPRRFFDTKLAPFSITTDNQKKRLMEQFGINVWFHLPFDQSFSSLSPKSFMDDVLKNGVNPSHVIVGHDFRFGQKRAGDAMALQNHGQDNDYDVTIHDAVKTDENYVISSTMIREAIREGEMNRANKWLGWQWEIEGEVIHGDKRGRELGYPTANMNLGDYLHPRYGIYAVEICIDSIWHSGVASIGVRPMFETPTPLCETFIFDFDQDIYGQIARVRPLHFLRPEKRFESLDDLINQMREDEKQARKILT